MFPSHDLWAKEINGDDGFDIRKVGPFIGAMNKDVSKESKAELEESELEWKQVSTRLTNRVRSWYIEQIGKL